ncbi:6199_t:CDS:2, partial [Gigaspora margarita]
ILNDHPDIITNQGVQKILKFREFFHDVKQISKIFAPIRTAILQLEKANCTIANCFIQLVRLISTIYHIPRERDTITFKNRYIEIVNNHWNELEAEPYILAYILHPEYRGASLRKEVWTQTALYAGTLWQSMGYKNKLSWSFVEDKFDNLKILAKKIFAITPYKSLTKIQHHNLFNAHKELSYSAKNKTKNKLVVMIQGLYLFDNENYSEEIENENNENSELDDDNDLVIPNYQVVVFTDIQYTSNKENNNSDIAMNDDHKFNLEELIHDQDFE